MKDAIRNNKAKFSIVTITAFLLAATQFINVVDKLAARYIVPEPTQGISVDSNGELLTGVATGIIDTSKIITATRGKK